MPRHPSLIAGAALAALLLATPVATAGGTPGDFDFYVFALSWSPGYCATEDHPDPAQCDPSDPLPFIVHGLWPQYERGYPIDCRSTMPSYVRDETIDRYRDILPSAGLAGHEWRAHGLCTALTMDAYFTLTREAYRRVVIPSTVSKATSRLSTRQIEQAFVTANPGMSPAGIAIACERGLLTEVRVCLTKDLAFRDCAEVDAGGCRAPSLGIAPGP